MFIEEGLTEWLTPSLVGEACYHPPTPADLALDFPTIDPSHENVLVPSFPETEEQLLLRTKEVVDLLLAKFPGKNLLLVSHAPCDLGAYVYM